MVKSEIKRLTKLESELLERARNNGKILDILIQAIDLWIDRVNEYQLPFYELDVEMEKDLRSDMVDIMRIKFALYRIKEYKLIE